MATTSAKDGPSGEYQRQQSSFRDWVSSEEGARFPIESGRYHLYVAYSCPWASRALIARKILSLEDVISFSAVHWHLDSEGWRFVQPEDGDVPGENVVPDPIPGHENFKRLKEVYFESNPNYQGRFTVPVLYDKNTNTIVNNESSDILRMLETKFIDLADESSRQLNLYPQQLSKQIDEANDWIYDMVNNGVYKCGFATTQEAYEPSVVKLFEGLDRLEAHFEHSTGPFYFGKDITEVDIRLFVTLVRFDCIYVQHFKCNIRDIRSGYPRLHDWLRNLYWNHSAFKDTTLFEHIKWNYTKSHPKINPLAITPVGPVPNILPLDAEVPAVTGQRR